MQEQDADLCVLRVEYDGKSRDVFGPNLARLQELKARFDPDNMFNKLFSVAPAV